MEEEIVLSWQETQEYLLNSALQLLHKIEGEEMWCSICRTSNFHSNGCELNNLLTTAKELGYGPES